jgi:hypothetical protein
MDEQHLVLLSIICQLLDGGADISNLHPDIQDYLYGFIEDLNLEEQQFIDHIYYYADTFFNKINENKKVFH